MVRWREWPRSSRFRRFATTPARPVRSSDLVAPPYDVIGPARARAVPRAEPVQRRPSDAARLGGGSGPQPARLARGRRARDRGARRSGRSSQDYVGPDGVARTRTGSSSSLEIEPYETGTVLPHERTHRGPKEGRLRLLRATQTQLEPIFLLYEGQAPFAIPDRSPELEVEGARLWRLEDTGIGEAFADRRLLIADGHHRYETALAYARGDGNSGQWVHDGRARQPRGSRPRRSSRPTASSASRRLTCSPARARRSRVCARRARPARTRPGRGRRLRREHGAGRSTERASSTCSSSTGSARKA